jgi:hypothetical protein
MRTCRGIAPGLRLAALSFVVLLAACAENETPVAPPGPPEPGVDRWPPARIVDPSLGYAGSGGNAILTWTAPRDNDRVDAYDIRYSYSSPLDWELSLRVADAPSPSAPGEAESYALVDLIRGRDLYAAIRSVDPSGNLSPISDVAHARIPGYTLEALCVVAITSAPVEGLEATVTAQHVHRHSSDPAGRFAQGELTAGAVNVAVRPGTSGVPFHYINHPFELDDDVSLVYKMIPCEPTALGAFESRFQLFKAAAGLNGWNHVFKKWRSIPVPVHVQELTNVNGLDYGEITRQAVDRWEERTGIDLFQAVGSPPDTGIVVAFKTRTEMAGHIGFTIRSNDSDGFPLLDEINVVDDFSNAFAFFQTMLHELGHTIRLEHLPSGYLMYAGQPLPADITDDEALLVQLYTALPNNLNIDIYDESIPEEAGRAE